MGGAYSLDKHGNFKQELYDSYMSSTDGQIADLSGKVVAITGTTTGSLGYYVAKAAVAKKAKLILLLNRPSERSSKTEADVRGDSEETIVQTVPIDLLSFDSVKKAADELNTIAKKNGGLDVLCCNAGIMARSDERTKDGYDVQMQANQLSHYLLTRLVMKSLDQAAEGPHEEARIVYHSSSARFGPDLDSKYFEKCESGTLGGDDASELAQIVLSKDGPWGRYHQTKLANSAFSMALHSELKEKGSKIKVLSCDPGWAHSNLQVSAVYDGHMSNFLAKLGVFFAQSAADGSLPCILACFSPDANSGDFYMPSKAMFGEPKKSIVGGDPVKENTEKETTSLKNQQTVMEACKKVFVM